MVLELVYYLICVLSIIHQVFLQNIPQLGFVYLEVLNNF